MRTLFVGALVSMLAIFINHFSVDWKAIYAGRVEMQLEALLEEQSVDLDRWEATGLSDERFSKRMYVGDSLLEWSDSRVWEIGVEEGSLFAVERENGVFLVNRKRVGDTVLISALPIIQRFSVSNKYLRTQISPFIPNVVTAVSIQEGSHQYRNLFFYEIIGDPAVWLDLVLLLVFVTCIFWISWQLMERWFTVVVLTLLVVRVLTLHFDVMETLLLFPLFDPLIYTSSFFNPTLGDLLVNCFMVFFVSSKWSRQYRVMKDLPSSRNLYALTGITILVGVCIFWVLWRIISNSQISLDVGKSLEFDYLRVVAYACVVLVVCSAFFWTFRLVSFVRDARPPLIYFVFLIAFPFLFVAVSPPSGLVALIFALGILWLSRLKWTSKLKQFNYQNLLFALIISIVSAGILSFSVYKYHEVSELDAKRKFANHLLIKKDLLAEYYLNELMLDTRDQGLRGDRRIEFVNKALLNPYYDKYEVRLASSSDSADYSQLRAKIFDNKKSDYERIYLVEEGSEFHYICDLDDLLISLQLKKRVPTSVFPALLTDSKYYIPSDEFDYAVFRDGEVLFQRSKFGQLEWLEDADFGNEKLYDRGIERNQRHYYGVKTADGRVILILSSMYGSRMQVTNFSFFFLLCLLFLGGLVLLSPARQMHARLSFTGKIQLYLGIAFSVPLLIAAFALLNSLNTSYKEEINRSYLKRSLYISELLSDQVAGDSVYLNSEKLSVARDFIQADISMYDVSGVLISTSQPEIFELGLQSPRINPVVFTELLEKRNLSIIADESIGGLEYKVSYAALNDAVGNVRGFIAMPFFDSRNHLKRQQLEVFGNLVSIFGFIFLFAVAFGGFLLDNLMKPLRLVADKISKVTLQEENKPIVYESSDEIGSLVQDYNSMLVKLEQSKAALARSQKEVAWKEIARQVAHEIKNPLTPMQLKIQTLMRKYEEGTRDFETLESLLMQVETLSQIASSFSAFAEMPAPDNVTIDFSRLVDQVVSLYQSAETSVEAEIDESVKIHADKDIFQRILNNLMLNAIQSAESGKAFVRVRLETKGDKCELTVADNGRGIDESLKDKIFLNYFSTKSSGSGIGLALAKKGIENAGGNIWFESEAGKGTTFYVTMPVVAG